MTLRDVVISIGARRNFLNIVRLVWLNFADPFRIAGKAKES